MASSPFDSAVAGKCVLVTETGMEPLQLLGRAGSASFVIAGSRRPYCSESLNPYELIGAALGSCTAMVLRLCADRMGIALRRVQIGVSHHSGYPDTVGLFEQTIFLEGAISADDRLRLLNAAQRNPVDLSLRSGTEIRTALSEDGRLAALAASSDYLSDIEQAAVGCGGTLTHAD